MSDEKNLITKEEVHGMVEDIVGRTLDQQKEKIYEDRKSFASELAEAMRDRPAPGEKRPKEQVMKDVSVMFGALAQSRGDYAEASKVAKAHGNDWAAKALGSVTVSAGAAMIQPEFASEMIELLRADTVILASGARVLPMESGILNFGRTSAGATAAYRGESVAMSASQPTTGELELRAKILSVLCPASNQFLSRTGGRGIDYIRQELVSAANDKMDATFIRSNGTQNTPKGLLYLATAANTNNETNAATTSDGSTLAEKTYDLANMVQLLETANVKMRTPGWIFAPRTKASMFSQLDSNGNFVFRDELQNGTLFGIPYKVTSNVPINLTAAAGSGSGSDASEIYLADFANIVIGETEGLSLSISNDGAYTVSGSLVSAFERGETLVRVEMEHDMVDLQVGASIAVLESVTWK